MPRAKKTTERRRTRGEGTRYQQTRTWRTRDGKTHSKKLWVAAVSEAFATEGGRSRRKRRFFYGPTAEAARAARNRYLNEIGKEAPRERADATTVEQYAANFVARAKAQTRATTANSYGTLRLHVLPLIGKLAIATLSADSIKTMFESLRAKVSASMSPEFTLRCAPCSTSPGKKASSQRRRSTECERPVPRYRRPRIEAMTEKQVKALFKAAKGNRLEALIVLALTTGSGRASCSRSRGPTSTCAGAP